MVGRVEDSSATGYGKEMFSNDPCKECSETQNEPSGLVVG